jgi:hypothetical protein
MEGLTAAMISALCIKDASKHTVGTKKDLELIDVKEMYSA